MPENDFEKQVQQKMDELQLRPSAVVWEEVERRIRKEKKRRIIILWFFVVAALLLGGSGWLFIAGTKKQQLADNPTGVRQTYKKAAEIKDTSSKQKQTSIKVYAAADTISASNQTKTIIVAAKNTGVVKKKSVIEMTNKISAANGKKINAAKNSINDKATKTDVTDEFFVQQAPGKLPKNKEQVIISQENPVQLNDQLNNPLTDSASVVKGHLLITQPVGIAADSQKQDSLIAAINIAVPETDSSKKKNNNWEIGIKSFIGISNKTDRILNTNKSLFDSYSSAITSPGSPQLSAGIQKPGNGFAWQVSGYVKRKLTSKTSLSAGLNFSSYSATQRTGVFVDSAVNSNPRLTSSYITGYYRSGTIGGSYTNHYYYLQLPVVFHWQLNKGKKLPLILQNGFSTGHFLGGNALVYNSSATIFYKDNTSFNKLQFSFQSGVYTKLFSTKNNPLMVGVLFEYGISKLQKENIIGGNHLSSFGIQLGWVLKK